MHGLRRIINSLPTLTGWVVLLGCATWITPVVVRAGSPNVSAILAPYVSSSEPHVKELALAIEAFHSGNLERTRSLLRRVCETTPEIPSPNLLLASILDASGQRDLARQTLELVSREIPDDPSSYLMLGELSLKEGRIDEAETWFRQSTNAGRRSRVSRHRELDAVARLRIGYAAVGKLRNNWKSVVRLLKPVVDHDPRNSRAVGELARGLFQEGDVTASYNLLRNHWEIKEKSIRRPEITMGVLFEQSGDITRAAHLMKLAVARSPSHAATQTFVSNWALEHGDLETAQHCAERALIATNSSVESRMLLARASRFRGELHLAREMLESVHLQTPENVTPVIELAIVLSGMEGLQTRGLRYAELATKMESSLESKSGREAAITKAWIHRRLDEPSDHSLARLALAAGEVNTETLFFAAEVLLNSDKSVAKKLLEQALRSGNPFPEHAEAKQLYVKTSW